MVTEGYTRGADAPGFKPWIPVALWTGVIAIASCLPAGSLEWFEPSGPDRLLHAVFYAPLAALTARAIAACGHAEDAVAAGTLVATLAFGAFMEWAQGFVERRPDVMDLVADAAGVLVALTLRAAWLKLRERPR